MYDTILIPTDGSDHAVRAGEHGFVLAELFDATVHVINVVDVQAEGGAFSAGGVGEEFVAELEADGEAAVEDVAALAGDGPLETAVLEGQPGETIVEYAQENDADLVAMGTHGRTGVKRYVSGSVCEHVIRHAPMPVLTARETAASVPTDAYDEILVPTDGSEAAEAVIDHSIAIAAAVDARLHAVNVVDLGDVAASSEYRVPNELVESLEERGAEATAAVTDRASGAGLRTVTDVVSGSPARDLLEYADEHDIDLVTMGTAGRTGLDRFLLGSTTERVVREADVPILTVNVEDATVE